MRFQLFIVAAAVALAAGCDRNDPARSPSTASSPPPASSSSASGGTTTNTPTTPANIGQQGSQEKKEGNPVQGQVDPKQREQHRDFQQKGDSAGPTSPDTRPKY